MRVLVVCHYFPPEIGAPQARVSELARSWTHSWDDVTVLTGMPDRGRRSTSFQGWPVGSARTRLAAGPDPNDGIVSGQLCRTCSGLPIAWRDGSVLG